MNKYSAFIGTGFFLLLCIVPVAYAAQATLTPSAVPSGVVQVGATQSIRWRSSNFPPEGKVDINLMRQVSVSPRAFVLVRQIAKGVADTGTAAWTPTVTDAGTTMYIQVACASGTVFKDGCASAEANAQVAVVSGPSLLAERDENARATANLLLALRDAIAALLKLLQSR